MPVYPKCIKENCFANVQGKCIALAKTGFKDRCPFFKTAERLAREKEAAEQRMKEVVL